LIIVIGIPNCIYFLNKFHSSYKETGDKEAAIINMISKMGIVTLFCNIAAAIGFAVFALTKSAILKEFGVVAGTNILALFLYFAFPDTGGTAACRRRQSHSTCGTLKPPAATLAGPGIERWSLNHRRLIYVITAAWCWPFRCWHDPAEKRRLYCG
jgi:hypothetical protein